MADYSQIELRLMAVLSQEPALLEALESTTGLEGAKVRSLAMD